MEQWLPSLLVDDWFGDYTTLFVYVYIYIYIYIYGIITIQGSWNPVLNKPVSQGLENTHPLHFCELRIFNLDLSPFPELSISLLMIVDISHDRSNKVPQCSCDIYIYDSYYTYYTYYISNMISVFIPFLPLGQAMLPHVGRPRLEDLRPCRGLAHRGDGPEGGRTSHRSWTRRLGWHFLGDRNAP